MLVEKKLESMKKEDFERYIQGTESPSKQTRRYGDSEKKRNPYNRFDSE